MPDELIVLGSSSGVPTARRFPPAYALRVTSKLFLLDCGAPVSTLLYRYGLDPIEVRAIFLSHWHMGHVANLGLLLSQNHHRNRPRALRVYGPRGTRGKIQRLLLDSFIVPEELSYKLKITNVKPDKVYEEALLRVTFFRTQHLEQPKLKTQFGRKAMACGMVVDGPGWRVVYGADVSSPAELAPYLPGCDLLIYGIADHQPELVAELVAAANIPHLLITHFSAEYSEAPERVAEAFASLYHGNLMIAEDGTRIRLSKMRENDNIIINA